MVKNLIIITLVLLLSLTTGFGVVVWKMNNKLAKKVQEEADRGRRVFKLWQDSNWLAANQLHVIEGFRKILRRHRIDWHEEPGVVLEVAPVAPAGKEPST